MKNNLGKTKIKTKRRPSGNLREFDSLPKNLRKWIRNAVLPWRPLSVKCAYNRALSDTGDPSMALRKLDKLQEYRLAKGQKT
mgnify:FL=1